VVIEGVLTEEMVEKARISLHEQLKALGVDHDKVLTGEETVEDGPRIKSKAARIFYAKWKLLDIQLNPRVWETAKDLLTATYSTGKTPGFEHPFGKVIEEPESMLCYIDRVCWRLPDCIKAEGGLKLHMDRNPLDPFLLKSTGLSKFRPIQAFVTLTDHYGGSSGGLQVVKGFHKIIDDFFSKDKSLTPGEGGEFFRMNSPKYAKLEKELITIQAPRGSLVCWDNRLPHATCEHLSGFDTREVVYCGFIPHTEINAKYIQQQREVIGMNKAPPAYASSDDKETVDRDWDINDLSVGQRNALLFG